MPTKKMQMTFFKYQGAGNDFLIADNRDGRLVFSTQDIKDLCDRKYGFGADGLMLLETSKDHDFRMVFYNPDGSGGMMCGNGGRCIVAFAARLMNEENPEAVKRTFTFEAADGLHQAEIIDCNETFTKMTVRLGMSDVNAIEDIKEENGYFLDTGTRHFVRFIESGLETSDITAEGKRLRHSNLFAPQGTNVDFVQHEQDRLLVRTYEKGVEDETYACGTGIVASAIAAWHAGFSIPGSDGSVHTEIKAKRDSLSVDFVTESDGKSAHGIWLTGPAVMIGTVNAAVNMKYDFDEIIPRRGTNSYKWDSAENPDVLPMWVADMDFRTAPAIIDALRKRVSHGVFGYTRVPQAYYDAVTGWFSRRHGWKINSDWIVYTTGVVPALSAIIKALASPGDKVLIQGPVYNCFYSSIRNNGCRIVSNSLIYKDNTYRIDFDDLKRKAADPEVRLMIVCNPHNPAGRVWTKEELTRIGEICIDNGVTVIADEIHCELVCPGHKYIPFASISEDFLKHSVTCISASKSFNIAGLQIANIVCEDKLTREKIDKAININEVCDVNPFGVIATIAAYNESEEWLTRLLSYIKGNYDYMSAYCRKYLPTCQLTRLEGTYLAWMDCRNLKTSSEALEERLVREAGLWLNAGTMYGPEGEGFMRWNIACPRTVLAQGLEKFRGFINKL